MNGSLVTLSTFRRLKRRMASRAGLDMFVGVERKTTVI